MINRKAVTGIAEVARKMKGTLPEIRRILDPRFGRAAKHLLRTSMKIVPVDLDILRTSAFHRRLSTQRKIHWVVGYTSDYAVYVHEDLEKAHGEIYNQKYAAEIADPNNKRFHSRGPNQQAKFLETPMRTERAIMFRIIAGKGI